MVIEHYENLVAGIAYEFSRKFHMVPAEDIRQELWVWFLEHPNKVKVWESLDGKQSTKLVARSLRNAAKDYCQREKAKSVGYRVEDNYYYDKEIVEMILPAVLRGDTVSPSLTDIGFSNTKPPAAEGGNWFAMMADVEAALERVRATNPDAAKKCYIERYYMMDTDENVQPYEKQLVEAARDLDRKSTRLNSSHRT